MSAADQGRRVAFDVLKGIGILEVILHHSLGSGSRKFAEAFSGEWWIMRGLNRIFHFAIPLFLLVAAVLLTRSLVKHADWKRFALRRAARTLWPYALWSGIYVAFRLRMLGVGSDIESMTATLPLLGTVTGPRLLVDLPELARQFLAGKIYFHLYFLIVLLQLAAALPIAIALLKRAKLSFAGAVAMSATLQLSAFWLQSGVFRIAAPASTVFWYVPSLLLGVWVGLNREMWVDDFQRNRRPLLISLAVGLCAYLPLSFALDLGARVSSIAYSAAFTVFSVTTALLLMGAAPSLAATPFGRFAGAFGRVSLPMFLVHPIFLYLLGGPRISALMERLPLSPLWTASLVVALSYGFARLVMSLRLDPILLGQTLPRPAPLPQRAPSRAPVPQPAGWTAEDAA